MKFSRAIFLLGGETSNFKTSLNLSLIHIYRGISCTVVSPELPRENARARKLIVDGEEIDGSFLPYDKIAGKQSVEIKVVY